MKIGRAMKHKANLNKLIKDERLHPHRRLLAEMLSMWMDVDEANKERILKLVEATFGSPRRTLWQEGDNPELKPTMQKLEVEATSMLKDYFAQAQSDADEIKSEILTSTV